MTDPGRSGTRWGMVAFAAATLALAAASSPAQEAILTEWVENNPFDARDRIALGYPPPIPVDTPLPFDGFRSYAGLRARHQDLAASTPWVHGEVIGQTRQGRTIWAYRLGDADRLTPWGIPEAATLTNGGIHAREWQTPEAVTGILELLATAPDDRHLYAYLRDQVNMVVIPVLNVDGFLQTQRTPTLNWLQTDPDFPEFWPRDGRMRRKNMLDTDEDLMTLDDHLLGVDLNRNNVPFWDSTNGDRSSDDERSLVHHGVMPRSEPETRALDTAAALGPTPQLRVYTDVHSYSQVHFWSRTDNERLSVQTERVLDLFTDHHIAFPAGKWYAWAGRGSLTPNTGIGTTDEYFTHTYEVPSWTLEVEPTNGQSFHAPLPGGGADYGGAGVNGHDGFILPESEIRRVREELAQSFAAVYFRQSGPPHVQSARLFDEATGALVYEADWDAGPGNTRVRHQRQLQPVVVGRQYTLWLGYSKPMRWLEDGAPARFPGRASNTERTTLAARSGSQVVVLATDGGAETLLEPGGAPDGYRFYRTDAERTPFRVPSDATNRALFADGADLTLRLRTLDFSGLGLDANPATVAGWDGGHWVRYEDELGNEADFGGMDETLNFTVTTQAQPDPFLLQPGIAAAWYDPERSGEGFIIEILPDQRATLYWFTYDDEGGQDWYIAGGTVDGNRLRFPELLRVSGGVFGPDFDPDAVAREVVGEATFLWSGCDEGSMDWHIGNRRGRQALSRLTRIQGLDCGLPKAGPVREQARYSGAWYDPSHSGEGFTVEVLEDDSAVVYWFSFGPDGERRWFFGQGDWSDGAFRFPTLYATSGPVFGDGFDPEDFVLEPWGSLELALSCAGGEARYESTEEGFGSGSLDLVQLTRMDGPACPTSR